MQSQRLDGIIRHRCTHVRIQKRRWDDGDAETQQSHQRIIYVSDLSLKIKFSGSIWACACWCVFSVHVHIIKLSFASTWWWSCTMCIHVSVLLALLVDVQYVICVCVKDKWSQPSGSRATEIWSCVENTCRTWLCVGILQDCDHQILNHNYTETPLGGPLICALTDTDVQKISRQAACLHEDKKENTYNRHTVSENKMLSRVRYALWSFISISAQVGMDYSTFFDSSLLALGQYTPIKS